MSYYLRLLTPSRSKVSADQVREGFAAREREDVLVALDEDEDEADWTGLIVYTPDGDPICMLTRDRIDNAKEKELALDEINEFREELSDALPKTGAAWVREYLEKVYAIYAVQLMGAADDEGFADIPGLLLNVLKEKLGGIIQADGEGFSNEAGHHVVWQFGEDVTGEWIMAVIDANKIWHAFEIDLDNAVQREAFLRGEVPAEARQIKPN